MGTNTDELDQARHQHHLQHRTESDKRLALLFWVAIIVVIVLKVVQRLLQRRAQRTSHRSLRISSWLNIRPTLNRVKAIHEAAYLCSTTRCLDKLISLSAGQLFLLAAYICTIGSCLVSVDAPKFSSHFVDDVAFRAAWITLTQIPFVYLLATKRGPLNLLTGVSYERINWIHRWVGRVLFLSATTHMSIMMSSISVADIFYSPDKIMIIVRYGVGAYGMLLWIVLTSVLPLRRWNHRLFHLNHYLSTLAFLWIIFNHVPRYARLPIYMSALILLIDRSYSGYIFWKNNIIFRRGKSRFRNPRSRRETRSSVGFTVKMTTPASSSLIGTSKDALESTIIIRICDVPFGWKAGQHVRLWIPRLGRLELHPFTPANCAEVTKTPFPLDGFDVEQNSLLPSSADQHSNDMVFMVRPQKGLTLRLAGYRNDWLSSPCPNASKPAASLTAFVDGPYGAPPAWEEYENLILVATSTGASFITAIVDYLDQLRLIAPMRLNTMSIRIIWTVRHLDPDLDKSVTESISHIFATLSEVGISVSASFYTTCEDSGSDDRLSSTVYFDPFAHLRNQNRDYFTGKPLLRLWLDENEEDEDKDGDTQSTMSVEPYPESHASSTLVDEDEELFSVDEPRDQDTHLSDSRWRKAYALVRKIASRKQGKPVSTHHCRCRHIQTVRQKQKPSSHRIHFITRTYGSRPDLARLISGPNATQCEGRTMVAVCGNRNLATIARNEVARKKLAYALGRRTHDVDIHTECFT